MKKLIIFFVIFSMIIIIGLCGCFDKIKDENLDESEENEGPEEIDYTIPPAISSLVYDEDKFEVYNLAVETWGYNDSIGEKIGDGFVSLPYYYEFGRYHINGTIKNIADYELEKVDITKNYYDENDNSLIGSGTTHYRKNGPMESICDGWTISLKSSSHSNTTTWERYNHMKIIITVID